MGVLFFAAAALCFARAVLVFPSDASASGQPCGTVGASILNLASRDSARVVIVYVAFPDQEDTVIPAFWRELEVIFADYFAKMSRGRHRPHLRTLLRPPPGGGCYLAPAPYTEFEATRDLPHLCRAVLEAAAGDHLSSLQSADVVILAFLQDCLPGISGMTILPGAAGAPYQGAGIVVDLQPREMFFGLVAHEYAHLLGFVHPPSVRQKHFGDYCLMDAKVHRLVPLCVENLHRVGWLDQEQVVEVTDTLWNVALADLRKGGQVLRVFATPSQYFWVCNHQGTDYDSVYAGRGLLVWHIKLDDGLPQSGPEVWDVESAAGLWSSGRPDPIAGSDSLDLSLDYTGSLADFFRPAPLPPGEAHFGPQTNPSSRAYRLVEGTWDSLVQDLDTGVSLRITAQRQDTLWVDVAVPNAPPRFLQVRPLPPAIPARTPVTLECAVTDDHRVEQVTVTSTEDTLLGSATVPMEAMGHGWWRATLRTESAGGVLRYYLTAADASGRTAPLPAQGWFACSVQEQPRLVVTPSRLLVSAGRVTEQRITLTNEGDGLLLFTALLVPGAGNATEIPSPSAQVVPHALEARRWWDAAQVTVAEGDLVLGAIKVKNDGARLYLRQEWHFLTPTDEYLIGVQFKSQPEQARGIITAGRSCPVVAEEPRWFAEPAITVAHGVGTDAQGSPCLVMEISIALALFAGAEGDWPRLGFFAQKTGTRPQETRAVAWPVAGEGFADGDLAVLRVNAHPVGLDVQPRKGAVPAHGSAVLTLRCGGDAGGPARLVLSTNDTDQPVVVVPIDVRPGREEPPGGLWVYPNPGSGMVTVVLCWQKSSGSGEVSVYDVLGRLVRVLARRWFEPGCSRLAWDGTDAKGVALPSGVYIVRASLPHTVYTSKLVRLR